MFPFLTAYDPIGKSTISIDPLGALQSYLALANLLLPGITTITTRSRYLSMMCWGLGNAERQQTFASGPAGLKERRRAILPYERLWALACVTAGHEGTEGAMDGLRGYRRATRRYHELKQHPSRVSPDFQLLRSQERTGAVGTYWTALLGGELVDPDSGQLMSEGAELAERFPPLPLSMRDLTRLADPNQAYRVTMTFDDLSRWSEQCHLSAAEDAERRHLCEILTADDRRECMAQALRGLADERPLPSRWDIGWLRKLRSHLAAIDTADRLALPETVDAIILMELFHEAILSIFDSLLWWGTEESDQPVGRLTADVEFGAATERARETACTFLQWTAQAERSEVRRAVESMTVPALRLKHTGSPREAVDEILWWHHRVQSGKLDGGAPKRDWIAWAGGDRLLRPSPLYQRTERPATPVGKRLTHPYRIEQFVQMLRENGGLPSGSANDFGMG